MKCNWVFLTVVCMSSFLVKADTFGLIKNQFPDVDLSHKEEQVKKDFKKKVKINPADHFPPPLFFDVKYPKTLREKSLLYLYNDKSSNENTHIPPIVTLSYVVDKMFESIANHDNTADILLMIEAIQNRKDININKQDIYGNTLLHYAIRYHNKTVFSKLLSTRMMDVNICNYAYICPIHLSIYKNDHYELKNLIMFGADIFHQNDRFEMPIIIAIKLNYRNAVIILAREHKRHGISDNMIDYIVYAANQQGYHILGRELYLFFKTNKEFE